MLKVFIDTNIFLDLFLERPGYAEYAEKLLLWCEEGKVNGMTSAISILNLHYFVRKQKSKTTAKKIIRDILSFISILETSHKDLLLAIDSDFTDFEDAAQYYTSLNSSGLKYIITRNKKDYKESSVSILTAEEFIKKFE